MKRTAIILMICTLFTKIIGFGRDVVLSYYYGISYISDAYLVSIIIPTTIVAFIATGLTTTFIPMYSNIIKEKGNLYADKYTNSLINFIIIICTFLFISVLLFAEYIIKLFASGFEGEVFNLAVHFTKISAFAMYFAVLIYLFSGYLNYHKDFVIPAIMGLPLNLTLIASIVISHNFNHDFLAIGMVVATFVQMLFLLLFIYKRGFRYKFYINIKDKYFKKTFLLSLPVILGVSVNQINVIVDRTMASQITIGGISALNYADRFNIFVQGIFVMSIVTVIYPYISKMASENNIGELKKFISKTLSIIILLVLPVIIGSMVLAKPMVKLLFGRGAFGEDAIIMTSDALFYYSIGMIGFALREILSRAFFSLQNTKTPMINAAISMMLNIVLNIILSKYMGINGLALATSISAIFCSILLFISLRKKIGPFGIKNVLITFFKVFFASLIMGLIILIVHNKLVFLNEILLLIISIILGVLVYSFIIYFMNIKEIEIVKKLTLKKIKIK
ncbi:murein biosynthesis integral membrane protein MurJ [Fictibacillus sp. NPDC058756]|uniref:murein biosynthesis integral membrane protein MurJ n=1 Tax=Fictibacillus sp. NPDC058756 TaxID=3346625 RepID=UPI00369FED8E